MTNFRQLQHLTHFLPKMSLWLVRFSHFHQLHRVVFGIDWSSKKPVVSAKALICIFWLIEKKKRMYRKNIHSRKSTVWRFLQIDGFRVPFDFVVQTLLLRQTICCSLVSNSQSIFGLAFSSSNVFQTFQFFIVSTPIEFQLIGLGAKSCRHLFSRTTCIVFLLSSSSLFLVLRDLFCASWILSREAISPQNSDCNAC